MKLLIALIVVLFILCLGSCKSLKEYRVSNYAHKGIEVDATYTVWLEKDFEGVISETCKKYWRDDSVKWRYKNRLMYFKYMSTHDVKGTIPEGNILPSVCLYSKKGIYVPTDTSYYFLHKMPFRLKVWKLYVKEMQETGKEADIMKRQFGDSIQIQKKLAKAKPLEEVFKKEKKIHFYWFYKFWENVGIEYYILFKAPNHPH